MSKSDGGGAAPVVSDRRSAGPGSKARDLASTRQAGGTDSVRRRTWPTANAIELLTKPSDQPPGSALPISTVDSTSFPASRRTATKPVAEQSSPYSSASFSSRIVERPGRPGAPRSRGSASVDRSRRGRRRVVAEAAQPLAYLVASPRATRSVSRPSTFQAPNSARDRAGRTAAVSVSASATARPREPTSRNARSRGAAGHAAGDPDRSAGGQVAEVDGAPAGRLARRRPSRSSASTPGAVDLEPQAGQDRLGPAVEDRPRARS